MSDGATEESFKEFSDEELEPRWRFDPPVHWDLDTCHWDYVVEQGLSGRDPYRDLAALKDEITAKTGPKSQVMREFWAALSLCITVFSRQDGLHLGWRRGAWVLDDGVPGGSSDGVPGGSLWTVEQVHSLRAWLWLEREPTGFRDQLGKEIADLNAESMFIKTLCKKTGIELMLMTLGPDSWELALA